MRISSEVAFRSLLSVSVGIPYSGRIMELNLLSLIFPILISKDNGMKMSKPWCVAVVVQRVIAA